WPSPHIGRLSSKFLPPPQLAAEASIQMMLVGKEDRVITLPVYRAMQSLNHLLKADLMCGIYSRIARLVSFHIETPNADLQVEARDYANGALEHVNASRLHASHL